MRYFVLSLLLALPFSAHAEIHIAWSLEQMTAEADLIVIGTLTEVKRVDGLGKKKLGVQLPITLEPERVLKGAEGDAPDAFFLTADGFHEKRFSRLEGERVLLFLRRTQQSYMHDQQGPYELWLMHDMETAPFVIELDALPSQYVLAAQGFSQPETEQALLEVIESTLVLAATTLKDAPAPKPQLLECPPESEAYGALYEGSSTYLYVPGWMFPDAQAGF